VWKKREKQIKEFYTEFAEDTERASQAKFNASLATNEDDPRRILS